MIWLWIALWVIVVSLSVALSFLLTVGRAFGRRQGPIAEGFQELVIGLGRRVGDGNPWVVFVGSWGMWIVIGVVAIWLIVQ